MEDEFAETHSLLGCTARAKQLETLADLFMRHRSRLRLMVELRLDPRLKPRVDPSDVLQEAYLEASKRLDDYLKEPAVPFFIWLRGLTGQKLHDAHLRHLKAQRRSVKREVPIVQENVPAASSAAMAARLACKEASPSQRAEAAEENHRVQEVLEAMEPMDREILALRYFEHLSSAQAAQLLGLKKDTARKRYLRALERLRDIIGNSPPEARLPPQATAAPEAPGAHQAPRRGRPRVAADVGEGPPPPPKKRH
jgi:RNA polymerase sigma-70 factor (ECF subfamily)